jgi:tellurite resistance protein TerC
MRPLFIALGSALIARFDWIFYVFGAILLFSGWKMMKSKGVEVHPDRNLLVRLARKIFPVETGYATPTFFVMKNGKLHITTMLIVLIAVETTDIVFAVDSIPAIFGITRDPFIVYSSNLFAILGLRSLYFLLAGIMDSFHYLSHGLSFVLIFIGLKMLLAGFIHIPLGLSLAIVLGTIMISIFASLYRDRNNRT